MLLEKSCRRDYLLTIRLIPAEPPPRCLAKAYPIFLLDLPPATVIPYGTAIFICILDQMHIMFRYLVTKQRSSSEYDQEGVQYCRWVPAAHQVAELSRPLAQMVIDEWAGIIAAGAIRDSSLGYLRVLVSRMQRGEFISRYADRVAEARKAGLQVRATHRMNPLGGFLYRFRKDKKKNFSLTFSNFQLRLINALIPLIRLFDYLPFLPAQSYIVVLVKK